MFTRGYHHNPSAADVALSLVPREMNLEWFGPEKSCRPGRRCDPSRFLGDLYGFE